MFKNNAYRALLVSGLVSFAGTASGQVFQQAIGTQANERAFDVEQTDDGGYVTVGVIDRGPFGLEDIYVCRYDLDGVLVWDTVLGGTGADIGNSIAPDGRGGFIIGAETTSVGGGLEASLIRLRPNGSVRWARTYTGGFYSDPLHVSDGVTVEPLPDNRGYVAVHHIGNQPTLLRVRMDGSLVFHRGYVVGASNQGFQQRIAFTDLKVDLADSSIIVSGSREESLGGGAVQQDFLLSRFTAGGDPVFMRAIDTASLKVAHHVNEKGCGLDFLDGGSGEMVIGGITDFGIPGQFGLQLITADPLGNPIDVMTYDVSTGLAVTGKGLAPGYASVRVDDRTREIGFAATYVDSSLTISQASHLLADSATLAPNWFWRYRENSDGQATVPVYDNCGWAVAGGTPDDFNTNIDKYLVKTDDNGSTGCQEWQNDPFPARPPMICDHYNPQWDEYNFAEPWPIMETRLGTEIEQFCHRTECDDSCPGDTNGDGVVDADDFFNFLDNFAAGDDTADIDGNGTIDANDFFAFLDLFVAGC